MRWLLLLPIAVSLSACWSSGPLRRSPDTRLVDAVESKLRKVPCVGSLDRWERHFTYSSKWSFLAYVLSLGTSDRWFDYSKLRVRFYQAGFEEFRTGRIIGQEKPPAADDREFNLVFGDYDIPSHTLTIWACGPNMGGPDVNIVVR
jgi:hypothetical protein